MGSAQSVRATHFNRTEEPVPVADHAAESEETSEENHISISNKMVERLVEDATVTGGAAAAVVATGGSKKPSRSELKDKFFMEKLKSLDDLHSERTGLTLDEVKAVARRIEIRTANMVDAEPVCGEYAQRVIDCYSAAAGATDAAGASAGPQEAARCWETVGAFSRCVHEATETRLRARTHKEAREQARRTRHVAHAREHALRDLAPAHDGTKAA